ncbi:MAG: DNA-binding response regulator [Epsilonproteobacteria bacterium]|nr:MAG: DNA-binding response regulator [Campylobacterota bacterium]
MNEIKLLLVDDHQLITDGLKSLLKDVPGIRVSATAENGKEAIEVLNLLSIDLVLMDIDMPVMNGLDATRLIKKREHPPRIMILSMHSEKGMVEDLINTGVDGYLLKNSGKEEIINAIQKVVAGEKYFASDVTLSLLKKGNPGSSPAYDLTKREVEILTLIADGFSNKEIGNQLFISHRTVDTHRTNMMKKLDVNNIAGLISYAIKNGIIS